MRQMKTYAVLLAMFAFVAMAGGVMAGCGGGGGKTFRADAVPPLTVTSASLPPTLSGEAVDFPIELAGGCGGPYVMSVIAGELPPGVGSDASVPNGGEPRHHLKGLVLEKGVFDFTLQITDTQCKPFLTTVQAFSWDIQEGALQIVQASPAINTDPTYKDRHYADVDCLETTVYGTLSAIDLIAAGGQPPYTCSVVDLPDDPLDNNGLPFGMNMAVDSCSIVGTPGSVGPGGLPHRISFRVTDSVGSTAVRTLQWTIDTPPIIISNVSLSDGTAGSTYSDSIQIVDGVPPFGFEFVDTVPGTDSEGVDFSDIDYTVSPPAVLSLDGNHNPYSVGDLILTTAGPSSNKLHGGSVGAYPPTNMAGPYGPISAFPSEGIYFVESGAVAGAILGIPRRVGQFTVMVHAYSLLVPNNRGQHAFKPFTYNIAQPQPIAINPSMALENSFTGLPGDGFPTLPEAELSIIYNPDVLSHPAPGLECLADGGVPEDGFTDSPHFTTRMQDITEVVGRYAWTGDNNFDGQGEITGLDMYEAFGLFGTATQADANSLPRQGRRLVEMSVSDQILPDALNVPQSQVFGVSVGPDTMIITLSANSLTEQESYYSRSNRHKWNDHQQKVLQFAGFSAGPVRAELDAGNMTATSTIPSIAFTSTSPTNEIGALLSGATGGDSAGVDLHRPTVVATGWWDDDFGLNPKAARHGKNAHFQRGYAYYGMHSSSYSNNTNMQTSVANLDLPYAQVTENKANGVYADGGRLYVFESVKRFGIFIIREDAKVYVPFAMEKSSTVQNFGDGLLLSSAAARHSALQSVQVTVSPDGRFAALKLKRDADFMFENATDSKIVIISLSGEKVFGGETYKIVESGVGETGSGNRILHSPSMALTNSHLYFLIGSRSASSNSSSYTPLYYQSFSGHYFMKYEIQGGASAASLMGSSDSAWTQSNGVPMQTTYQHTGPIYSSSYPWWESYTYYGNYPYHRYWHEDGMNLQENGQAPQPFRVSANGRAVAFMAAQDSYSTASSNNYYTYGWVSYDGSDPRRITTARRHAIIGSTRGYSLVWGPEEYAMWGRYTGPTTGLEVSDDGLSVAFVYNTQTGTIYTNYSASSSSHAWHRYRENVHLSSTTSGDAWSTLSSTTQREVTSTAFGGSHKWRFGCLAFTGNTGENFEGGYDTNAGNRGLVFWGGAPVYQSNSTSYTYNRCYQFAGTMYATALSATSVTSMLGSGEGGIDGGVATYSASSPFNPSATAGSSSSANVAANRRFGVLQPLGGFMSKNRRFMYICSIGAMSTSEATACKLVGMNVSTMESGTFNGHTNAQGDVPASWPSRRGFMGNYIYYPYYPLYYGYAPEKMQGMNRHAMAAESGTVFWMSNYQYSGPGRYYYYGGPPVTSYYYGCYGRGGTGMYAFNADMNGAIAALHQPSWVSNSTGSSYYSLPGFMEIARDGSRVAYMVHKNSSYGYYRHFHDGEQMHHVSDIDFDTTNGSIASGFNANDDTEKVESQGGRMGESMTIPPDNGADVWYAYKAGASNETSQEMVKASRAPDGTWTKTTFPSLPGRMNVLHGGR